MPEAGGLGNVRLDIAVAETSTGYEQKTTELITVAATPLNIQLIPESSAFKPTLPFGVLLVTETPGGEPVEARVNVDVTYSGRELQPGGPGEQVGRDQPGHGAAPLRAAGQSRAHERLRLVR